MTVQSSLKHDGEIATSDEEMSPTTERLAVYLWLTLIDERLLAYVSRVYAHDLQSQTLKDIQPQLAVAMDQLLLELNAQEDINVNYSRASYKYRPTTNRNSYNSNKKSTFSNSRDVTPQDSYTNSTSSKVCGFCKAHSKIAGLSRSLIRWKLQKHF